ncbi:BANK1 protein, partial [Nothoprocta ornata]|nr:BANK1 protein [Nothoprocta pentlandii]NWY04605.1 BANK1 protein [Nothoprocta ornata]
LFSLEHTKDILVIYEQEAEEWALYLKTLFRHIVNEEGILLYSLDTSSIKPLELFSLSCYKCKLLILSGGLVKSLNQKRGYFLEQVLKPPDDVVILLCGVENSDILYNVLTLDGGSREISTDQEPEEYLSIVTRIIQSDFQNNTDVNLSSIRRASEERDLFLETNHVSETLETHQQSALVLPARISCENPGEIFILLKDEVDDETLEIEFIADNQRIRTHPASWNQKVKYMKALDFPAGPVYINVYCGGVIKAMAQIEYYTELGEIENILKKLADPIAFACQAFEFSSVEKLDNILTLLLKIKMSAYEFSTCQSEECHQLANLEELPTLFHCAAKLGLKNLTALLLKCPQATQACSITNKDGDSPAGIAEKHGHKELQKLIRDFLTNTADNFTSCEEEVEEDDTYVLMLGSETQPASSKQSPGDQHGVGSRRQRKAEVDEEKEEDVEDNKEETKTEHEDKVGGGSYSCSNSYSLYANLCDEDPGENIRHTFFYKRPPLPPPRNLAGTLRQDDLHHFAQERNLVEDRSGREHSDGNLAACYREDEDTCEEDEEEDPYSCARLDDCVYDMILADEEERRAEHRSFIGNRPPAPAPRPVRLPCREENTPYIVQVFQQKATRSPSDQDKLCCDARKQGHMEMVTYSTLRHTIPAQQEDLIHLQEKVKKGTISVDEALEKFKQWQTEK